LQCDGRRPECSGCKEKRIECFNDIPAGQTHKEARRQKQEALHHDLRVAIEFIDHLKYAPEAEAQATLRGLRGGCGPKDLLEAIRDPTPDGRIPTLDGSTSPSNVSVSSLEQASVDADPRRNSGCPLALLLNDEDGS
jgi:hypothetical protein